MWMTVCSLFIALALIVGMPGIGGFDAFIAIPTLVYQVLFSVFLIFTLMPLFWVSMLCAERKHKPVAVASVQSVIWDRRLSLYALLVFFFSLIGLIVVSSNVLSSAYTVAVAVILTGAIFDVLRLSFYRIHYRATATGVSEWLVQRMQYALTVKDGKVLMDSFETCFPFLAESMKSGDVVSLRELSQKASIIVEILLRAVGKLTLFSTGVESGQMMLDRFTFAEAMTAKRLAWLIDVAREKQNPAAIEEAVRLYVKIFLVFHSHHASLGSILLISLCQQTQKSEDRELNAEVIMALSEVVKSLIDRSVDTLASEKETILRTIKLLETYIKESYRRDRSISVALLMQPFAEIGQLLGSTRYDNLPDREDILTELRRILAQFAALETVSGRFEMGTGRTDTSATFTQDIPFSLPKETPEEHPENP